MIFRIREIVRAEKAVTKVSPNPMIRVFKKRYPNAKTVSRGGGDITLHMEFNDAVDMADQKSGRSDACIE